MKKPQSIVHRTQSIVHRTQSTVHRQRESIIIYIVKSQYLKVKTVAFTGVARHARTIVLY